MNKFLFELGALVTIIVSGEKAQVEGRAEYVHSENQYYLRYRASDGRAVEAWWAESALQTTPTAG